MDGVLPTTTILKSGISIDDVYKIRILDSETATKSEHLRNECNDFVESEYKKDCVCSLPPKIIPNGVFHGSAGTATFQQIVDGFLSMIEALAQNVEKEKMKAIGSSNLVSSMAKIREAEQIQLQVRLRYKCMSIRQTECLYWIVNTKVAISNCQRRSVNTKISISKCEIQFVNTKLRVPNYFY